jgi:predicted nucleic acid-binding protein
MTNNRLLDSSIIISYLLEEEFKEAIEKEKNSISDVTLFEIQKKLLQEKVPSVLIQKNIMYIKQKCVTKAVTHEILEKAAEQAVKNNLSALDAIIYATSIIEKKVLLTRDNDFRDLPNVQVV